MNFALVYIIQRFLYRLGDFFHNWYIHGSRNIFHFFISKMESIDKVFALKVTLRYFFQPLYKDYTVVGRILGVVFRSGRILIAVSFYLVISAIFFLIYLSWLIFPPAILIYAAKGF